MKARTHPSLEAKVVKVASWEAMRVEARKRIVERRNLNYDNDGDAQVMGMMMMV